MTTPTTRVIPASIDATGTTEVGPQLLAFLATVQTGQIVRAPAGARYRCDQTLPITQTGVQFFFEGATFIQTHARPFGATRSDGAITGGTHLTTGTQLPLSCNWGYVSGPGVPNGTHIVLRSDRKGGTLDNVCLNGAGLPLVFTSKQDRGRCGFEVTGTDVELHDATWVGANPTSTFVSNLEAQCGVNFAGATNIHLDGISSNHMYGDGMYFTAAGPRLTTHVTAVNGVIDANGRSGLVPANCQDISVSRFVIDHVGRTVVDFEPPDASCVMDRFFLTDSVVGSHQLTLMSSGGNVGAHIGQITFARNTVNKKPMILWLVAGNATHKRGPYTIVNNHSTSTIAHGGTYPTAALIAIANAAGATVTGNTGIVLQERTPPMAVVRSHNNTTVPVVSGNQFTGNGCIENGPWI